MAVVLQAIQPDNATTAHLSKAVQKATPPLPLGTTCCTSSRRRKEQRSREPAGGIAEARLSCSHYDQRPMTGVPFTSSRG